MSTFFVFFDGLKKWILLDKKMVKKIREIIKKYGNISSGIFELSPIYIAILSVYLDILTI